MRVYGGILVALFVVTFGLSATADDTVTRIFTWPTVMNDAPPTAACHWHPEDGTFSTSLSLVAPELDANTVTHPMPMSALGFGIVCQRRGDGTLAIGILETEQYLQGRGPTRVFTPTGELDAEDLSGVGILADGTVVKRDYVPAVAEEPDCTDASDDPVHLLLIVIIEGNLTSE